MLCAARGMDASRQAKLRTTTTFRTSTLMTMASSILTSLMSTMTIRLVPWWWLYANYTGRLFRQPVICLRASLSRACSFSRFVSFSKWSSSIARICSARSSELAAASMRYVLFIAFGACFASMSCSRLFRHVETAASLTVCRYFLSTLVFSSTNFLYTS